MNPRKAKEIAEQKYRVYIKSLYSLLAFIDLKLFHFIPNQSKTAIFFCSFFVGKVTRARIETS